MSTLNSTISQDGTGGRAADEMKLFASLHKQHKANPVLRVNSQVSKKKPIRFKDAVGRKFIFPFDLAATWLGIEELIRQAFLHVDIIGPHVADGHYDLVGPSGEIILPQVWETVIQPDWSISMHMWPMPEPPGRPSQQPQHLHPPSKHVPRVPKPPPVWTGPPPPPPGRIGPLPNSSSTGRQRKLVFRKAQLRAMPPPPMHRPSVSQPIAPIVESQQMDLDELQSEQKLVPQQDKENVFHNQFEGGSDNTQFSTAPTEEISLQSSRSSNVTVQTLSETVPQPLKAPEQEIPWSENVLEWLSDENQTGVKREGDMKAVVLDRMSQETDMLSGLVAQYLAPESESFEDGNIAASSGDRVNTDMEASGIEQSEDLRTVKSRDTETNDVHQMYASSVASMNSAIPQPRVCAPAESPDQSEVLSQEDLLRLEFTPPDQALSYPGIAKKSQYYREESLKTTSLHTNLTDKYHNLVSAADDLLLIDFDIDSSPEQIPPRGQESVFISGEKHPTSKQATRLRPSVSEIEVSTDQTIENSATPLGAGKDGDVESLLAQIEELKQANAALQSSLTLPLPSQWVHLHRVQCKGQVAKSVYMDMPIATKNGALRHLEGRVQIEDMDDYFDEHPEVAFVVFLDYICDGHTGESSRKKYDRVNVVDSETDDNAFLKKSDLATHASEATHIECEVLREGLENLSKSNETLTKYLPFDDDLGDKLGEIRGPYLFYFYFQSIIDEEVSKLEDDERQQVQLFTTYISKHFDKEWARAQALFQEGFVSPDLLEFLFVPDEVVLQNDGGNLVGYQQKSNPRVQHSSAGTRLMHLSTRMDTKTVNVSFEAEGWEFDGNFRTLEKTVVVEYGKGSIPQKRIDSLKAYPLRYASQEIQEKHRKRGEVFWKCRTHRYVTYSGMTYTNDIRFDRTRFMVDVATYWKIHNDKRGEPFEDQLGDAMNETEPPEGNFIFLLPPNIYGFNMQEKKWMDLQIDCISEVEWNKKAFETLAVDEDTKELITALVSNKLAADKGTDLMSGKGNGLIVLLHGGPGTGKTLTAESVAEIAEKPLYRVTCGDLGIDPIKIEDYLDSVFHLGKIWDCVVLLDEADVFLEQRTLNDLSRNALVSVFLRALEYYDGILVLTSNRVGTFDEAFKSRIQLALHYEALNKSQRHQIWENFIRHLRNMNDNLDVDDVTKHISELAEYELNGRQIRNAVTTARQLALFKGKQMAFDHLKHVIKVSAKFDKYLFKLKAGATDDDWARDEGIR